MKNIVIVLVVIAVLAAGGWYYMSMSQKTAATDNAAPNVEMNKDTTSTPAGVADEQANAKASTTFTMAEVATHASAASCYSVIRGEVYDLTSWIGKHPGGDEEILQLCGKDGTDKFVGKHGGSAPQEMKLETFVIGTLAQ